VKPLTLRFTLVGETPLAAPKTVIANDYKANPDAITLKNGTIQKSIEAAVGSNDGGTITLKPGIYLTGSLSSNPALPWKAAAAAMSSALRS
jgi:hypothetical protein